MGTGRPHRRAESWRYIRDVLFVLTRHEFRNRYRAQALGVVWSLLHPVIMMGILSLVFTRLFHGTVRSFPIFLLIGLIVWSFFSAAAGAATSAWLANVDLVKRSAFPRRLLPLAVTASFLINLVVESVVLLVFIPIFPEGFRLSWALLLVPVALFFLLVLAAGVALMVSVLNVIYRDVAYLVTTGLLILYWATPLVYPRTILAEPYRQVLAWNPLAGIVEAIRGCVMDGQAPALATWGAVVVPTLVVFVCGWLLFDHLEGTALDHV